MGSRYSIGSVYGMEYRFKIFIRKKRDDNWLLNSMCICNNKCIWGYEMALEK